MSSVNVNRPAAPARSLAELYEARQVYLESIKAATDILDDRSMRSFLSPADYDGVVATLVEARTFLANVDKRIYEKEYASFLIRLTAVTKQKGEAAVAPLGGLLVTMDKDMAKRIIHHFIQEFGLGTNLTQPPAVDGTVQGLLSVLQALCVISERSIVILHPLKSYNTVLEVGLFRVWWEPRRHDYNKMVVDELAANSVLKSFVRYCKNMYGVTDMNSSSYGRIKRRYNVLEASHKEKANKRQRRTRGKDFPCFLMRDD